MRKTFQCYQEPGLRRYLTLLAFMLMLGNSKGVLNQEHSDAGLAFAAPGKHSEPRSATPRPNRSRTWERAWTRSFREARMGGGIRFELIDKEFASGVITTLEETNGDLVYVSGKLVYPEPGRFFFVKQSLPGRAGEAFGVVEFTASQKSYRLEPTGPGGAPALVERRLDEVMCIDLPRPSLGLSPETPRALATSSAIPADPSIPPYQNGIISLQSLRGAAAVVYLDFQGGYTPAWRDEGVYYDRPAVSNDQIRDVWQRVAEDFLPFTINVTTDLKVFENATPGSRQRVIITPTSFLGPGLAGVAYLGTFNSTYDLPCWSFITSGKCCADIISHEAGHTFWLSHMGANLGSVSSSYYAGHGSGETSWGPIMGQPYSRNLTTWCKGDYAGANCFQDELLVMTTQNNNVSYRFEDAGELLTGFRYLEVYPDFSASAEGIIERTEDADAFQFTTAGGEVSLLASPFGAGPNLALNIALYDAEDHLLASTIPQTTLWASLNTNLPAGAYSVRVSGAGRGDPLLDGFSSYGALGFYSITGFVADARLPNRFSVPEHATNGTLVGWIPPLQTNGHPYSYQIVSGNKGHAFAIDDSGQLVVSENESLDYNRLLEGSPYRVQFELFVDILDNADPSLSEYNRRVVVSVTPFAPLVAPPQKLEPPLFLGDGTLRITSRYADGSSVLPADLGRFEAQVSPNLRDWETLPNSLSCSNGSLVLIDSEAGKYPARFYRILDRIGQ